METIGTDIGPALAALGGVAGLAATFELARRGRSDRLRRRGAAVRAVRPPRRVSRKA